MTPVSVGLIKLTPIQPVGGEIARARTTDLLRRKPMFYPRATTPSSQRIGEGSNTKSRLRNLSSQGRKERRRKTKKDEERRRKTKKDEERRRKTKKDEEPGFLSVLSPTNFRHEKPSDGSSSSTVTIHQVLLSPGSPYFNPLGHRRCGEVKIIILAEEEGWWVSPMLVQRSRHSQALLIIKFPFPIMPGPEEPIDKTCPSLDGSNLPFDHDGATNTSRWGDGQGK
ncbi:hypothetical protein EGW08_001495 [Elysia chlorotica]|uniref:Uncharacterized protein n=1 Tax=Elysia chlorotica TaxID=188477 RepID=A0A3S1BL06_ELYCH|nr:hypothetical protein EGW08_001495 [Elysia chlorotica]